jgi:hypothetical protein
MSELLHNIKIGNQTDKLLIVSPNGLDPKLVPPGHYIEWDSAALAVDVQVAGQSHAGQLVQLGGFSYSNTEHNYADIHAYPSGGTRPGSEFYTLYDYLEGETIHAFQVVPKSLWDSLRSVR